ncbi:MAG: hypothetical protein IT429_25665 [Gemmataceae bacterium]|nr:hypothetical protein [Gemmataceae bacterium]
MNPRLVELIWSLVKHAGIVGIVAFLVALGQGVSGSDWSSFGPLVGPVVVPVLILVLSTLAKSLQKGTELALRKDEAKEPDSEDGDHDGPGIFPFQAG